jgi:hypothetical protein
MSKAGVHFFLCILGMLPRFNFLEIRIFFWKDLPVLGWGRRFLASVSYCTSALLKGVDSAQTLTRKSKGTQLQSPTFVSRFVLGALPFPYVLTHVLHNFLFSRYTVEVYRLGDLCKSGYKISYLVGVQ